MLANGLPRSFASKLAPTVDCAMYRLPRKLSGTVTTSPGAVMVPPACTPVRAYILGVPLDQQTGHN
jgi:hypothetical protein